jgi:hypothetical protein
MRENEYVEMWAILGMIRGQHLQQVRVNIEDFVAVRVLRTIANVGVYE